MPPAQLFARMPTSSVLKGYRRLAWDPRYRLPDVRANGAISRQDPSSERRREHESIRVTLPPDFAPLHGAPPDRPPRESRGVGPPSPHIAPAAFPDLDATACNHSSRDLCCGVSTAPGRSCRPRTSACDAVARGPDLRRRGEYGVTRAQHRDDDSPSTRPQTNARPPHRPTLDPCVCLRKDKLQGETATDCPAITPTRWQQHIDKQNGGPRGVAHRCGLKEEPPCARSSSDQRADGSRGAESCGSCVTPCSRQENGGPRPICVCHLPPRCACASPLDARIATTLAHPRYAEGLGSSPDGKLRGRHGVLRLRALWWQGPSPE